MGEYVNAGDVRTYYEVHGRGEPVVFLHGGFGTVESWLCRRPCWQSATASTCPNAAATGARPTSRDRSPTTRMSGDTTAFLDAAVPVPAHLVRWSDGAVVGVLVALRRPELVRKLVVIGQYFNPEVPEFRAMIDHWDSGLPEALHEVYDQVSPDGAEHFPVVLEKMMRMWREEPDSALSELAGVRVPTMVMQGDDDIVEVEHSAALVATLPDAQLAVIPGTSHMASLEKPDLVNRLILDFLDDPQPEKKMALRS